MFEMKIFFTNIIKRGVTRRSNHQRYALHSTPQADPT
jgi:hypothetical protein